MKQLHQLVVVRCGCEGGKQNFELFSKKTEMKHYFISVFFFFCTMFTVSNCKCKYTLCICLHEGLTDSFSADPNKQTNVVVSVYDVIQPCETMVF